MVEGEGGGEGEEVDEEAIDTDASDSEYDGPGGGRFWGGTASEGEAEGETEGEDEDEEADEQEEDEGEGGGAWRARDEASAGTNVSGDIGRADECCEGTTSDGVETYVATEWGACESLVRIVRICCGPESEEIAIAAVGGGAEDASGVKTSSGPTAGFLSSSGASVGPFSSASAGAGAGAVSYAGECVDGSGSCCSSTSGRHFVRSLAAEGRASGSVERMD